MKEDQTEKNEHEVKAKLKKKNYPSASHHRTYSSLSSGRNFSILSIPQHPHVEFLYLVIFLVTYFLLLFSFY